MNKLQLHNYITELSYELGFVGYGAVSVHPLAVERKYLEASLSKSYNGTMNYLARNLELRENPALLLDGAVSIMALLIPYKPGKRQNEKLPKISSYAYGLDYHFFVKGRLRELAERIKTVKPSMEYRVFTDSAPIFERALAREAGLGFIGKNTFLINKSAGLHTIIGIIVTNLELLYNDKIVREGCGNCRRCIDSCPTGAIVEPYTIDSRKCISYQTIEAKIGDPLLYIGRGNNIFGCEICLNACPWASKGGVTKWSEFSSLRLPGGKEITSISEEEWLEMDNDFFKLYFSKSPLLRAGLEKIKENVKELKNKII